MGKLKNCKKELVEKFVTLIKIRSSGKEISSEVKTHPKKFWSYVRQKTTIRQAIPALIKPNGMLTDTDDEKAEVLSNFFASVFTDEPPGN